MPLSSIVVIVLRIFALYGLFWSLPLFGSASITPLGRERSLSIVLAPYAPALLLVIFATGLWILARAIGRLVSRGVDTSVSIGGLTRVDLYSFAFVIVGLYFILSSFADVINWIHYLVTASHNNPAHNPSVENFYQLTRCCLTFVAGFVSLLGAPHWTKKLVSHDLSSTLKCNRERFEENQKHRE
jgi:hypothetical protein